MERATTSTPFTGGLKKGSSGRFDVVANGASIKTPLMIFFARKTKIQASCCVERPRDSRQKQNPLQVRDGSQAAGFGKGV